LHFDDGEQRERPIQNFETEDGLPLMIRAAPGSVTMRPGLRIRNWKNGRTGVIDEVLVDGRMAIQFDDGDQRIRSTENFESRDGRRLKPVQGGFSKATQFRPAYQGYGGAVSNGWGWGDQRAVPSWNGTWKGEKGWGGRGTWKGGPQTRPVGERRSNQRRKRLEDADPKLVKSALKEVTDQLKNPKYEGHVWIDNWPGRYQPQLGQLRDFLESRPDLFKVVRKGDRAYAVTLKDAEANGDEKPVAAEGVHDPDEGVEEDADDDGDDRQDGENDDEDDYDNRDMPADDEEDVGAKDEVGEDDEKPAVAGKEEKDAEEDAGDRGDAAEAAAVSIPAAETIKSKHQLIKDDESDKEWGNMVDDEKEGALESEH